MASEESVKSAIGGITIDLPFFLTTPGKSSSQTGYERLVAAGKKYGIFRKQDLDDAINTVSRGMDMDLKLGGPEREQQTVPGGQPGSAPPAAGDARPADNAPENAPKAEEAPGEKLYTDKWLKARQESIRKNEEPYSAQGPLPDDRRAKDRKYLETSASEAASQLYSLGVLKGQADAYPPENNGVPSVFLMQDGKVRTLKEAGLWIGEDHKTYSTHNPEFAKAMIRGEVFAYLPGERYPVQLQGSVEKGLPAHAAVKYSAPLKPGQIHKIKLDAEPEIQRKPRWYHRAFQFWGNNRKICEAYDSSVAAHRKWEQDTRKAVDDLNRNMPESERAAIALDERFGAQRTQKVLREELNRGYETFRQRELKQKRTRMNIAQKTEAEVDHGIDVALSVYATKPQIREDWVAEKEVGEGKYYTREDFSKLTGADIDLSQVKIGDKPVTEREFATLALFSGLDPKIGVEAQRKTVSDPAPLIQGIKTEGFSQEESELLISRSISGAYTVDILHTDSRMGKYFEIVNMASNKAAAALKAYPQDKKQLAQILANGIGSTAEKAGATVARGSLGDHGVNGMVKLSCEMLDLLERDPELKQMAKTEFERTENTICTCMNNKISQFTENGKGLIKPRSFEDAVKAVREYEKFTEIEQKGLKAEYELQKAEMEDRKLDPAQKQGLIKDVLKKNMIVSLYEKQYDQRAKTYSKSSHRRKPDPGEQRFNAGRQALDDYEEEMNAAILNADEDGLEGNVRSVVGGSSLPASAPNIIVSGEQALYTEKMPVVHMVNQPGQLESLDRHAQQIMEQDGLDKMELDDLNKQLYHDQKYPSAYFGDGMILRSAKLGEAQPEKQVQPELERQRENNNPEAGMVL